MKKIWILIPIIFALFFISGCNVDEPKEIEKPKEVPKHNSFVLDKETIEELNKGIIKGTPLKLDKKLHMSDIEAVWNKPDEHYDYEDIQTYVYKIKNQRFVINEDEMKEIYSVYVELDYTKKEILERMGKPTTDGSIVIYEKEHHIIQFEKFNKKWRLILRKR